ncbi:MAG: S9 family peptidase [Gaiellales bacterium]
MSDLIPRAVLFGNPERSSPAVSPDGARVAYLAPDHDVLNVWVGPIDAPDTARPVTADRERPIRTYFWADDNRHLVYLQDTGGDEDWHVHVVDLETGDIRDVTPFEGVQAQVIGRSRRHPGKILLGLNRDNPQLHDPHLLDLHSGELTKLAENPGYAAWLVDNELRPRGGMRFLEDGSVELDADGRTLHRFGPDDALTTDPIGFDADDNSLYLVTSDGRNAAGLERVDVKTGERVELAADPTYDVGAVELHPDTRAVEVVTYVRDRREHQVVDPELAGDVERMRAVHPGDLFFGARDHSDRTWTIGFTADDGPVAFYLYDRQSGEARFLFHHQPRLAEYALSNMQPFSFTSRDGLEVHGYLTFPASGRESLPTVLNVHGGPWARDVWGYDPTAQWLANRGYLCVQVNYRGSTGYGKAFVNAGDREWGARMHDDLVDAVEHVVGLGYADSTKVAIYGGSYGGYAALLGATFTPDLFACAVDIVGPSNLLTLIESVPAYWMPMIDLFKRRVGDPETERDFLWSRSPLSRVDAIRIPMLIAQGANDPRVKQAESEQIVAAMRERGIPHSYMVFPDEGHGFKKPENSEKFHAEAERFLAEHLGGAYEEEVPQ